MGSKYELIDSGNFKKFEKLGDWHIVRPSPAAVWRPKLEKWSPVHSEFFRFENGKGKWEHKTSRRIEKTPIDFEILQMLLEPTSFGHLGAFIEQKETWEFILQNLKGTSSRVLNLFAYTGGSTLAAAKAGAEVVHLDASKTSVEWARENARLNGLGEAKIRWLVDDVTTFVKREVRRQSQYEGIILDPPTYGLGSKKQVWKIDNNLLPLLDDLKQMMSKNFRFLLLSSHTPGHSPMALENLLRSVFGDAYKYSGYEMKIPSTSQTSLPAGVMVKMTPV